MTESIIRIRDTGDISDPGLYLCKGRNADGLLRFTAVAVYGPEADDIFEEVFDTETSAVRWLRGEWSCFEGYAHDADIRRKKEEKADYEAFRESVRNAPKGPETSIPPWPPVLSNRESDFMRRNWFTCSECGECEPEGDGFRCSKRGRTIRWDIRRFGCGKYCTRDGPALKPRPRYTGQTTLEAWA